MVVHEKPFLCRFKGCGMRFEKEEDLKAHVLAVHAVRSAHMCVRIRIYKSVVM
jgi:hypothetical protein